jgi:hypothetical protein
VDRRLCRPGGGDGDYFASLVEKEHWLRYVPEQAVEQVGKGEYGRAAGQKHRAAVQDGKA